MEESKTPEPVLKRYWRVTFANGKRCTFIDDAEIDHATALAHCRHRFFENCIGVE